MLTLDVHCLALPVGDCLQIQGVKAADLWTQMLLQTLAALVAAVFAAVFGACWAGLRCNWSGQLSNHQSSGPAAAILSQYDSLGGL